MYRSGLFVALALVLAGCAGETPPPVAQNQPPPPQALHRPRPLVKHTKVAVTPRPKEQPVQAAQPEQPAPPAQKEVTPAVSRPAGEGTLTALTVGNYMDTQEKDLRRMLRGSGVIVSRVGDSLVLNIPDGSLFANDSGALSEKGNAIIHTVAGSAHRFNSTLLFVNGFSDTAAPAGEAARQTQKYANAVGMALTDDGIDLRRISAKGYGTENLKVPTGPNVKEPRNRRIEIDIAPRMKT